MFDSQKLSEFLTKAIYREFNLAKPSAHDDGGLFFSPDTLRRMKVVYDQPGSEHPHVTVLLRANVNCDPLNALQNLAVIQYMRQELKDRFRIDSEFASYLVNNSSGLSHYQISVPIEDEDMAKKFVDFMKDMNSVIYIDETNCMSLFTSVINELLYDRW